MDALVLVILFSLNAHAQRSLTAACGRLINCGIFAGMASQKFSDGVGSRDLDARVQVTEPEIGILTIAETITGDDVGTLRLNLKLDGEDRFTVTSPDAANPADVIGEGRCEPGLCHWLFRPAYARGGGSLSNEGLHIKLSIGQVFPNGRAFQRIDVVKPAAVPRPRPR